MNQVKIGDEIQIISMKGEPTYTNRTGFVEYIDDAGQIHGSWGGLALIPEEDKYIIVDYTNRAIEAIKKANKIAEENGISNMTLEEINAEIDAARKGKD